MADVLFIGGVVVIVFVSIAAFAIWSSHEQKMRRLMNEQEAAFDERIEPYPFDNSQIARLRELVSSVGAIALENQDPNRYDQADRYFHVFVIDSEGAVHDVIATGDALLASRTARGLALLWNVALEDDGGAVLPLGELHLPPHELKRLTASTGAVGR